MATSLFGYIFQPRQLGTDHYFPRGGILIGKKVVCMRKIAQINCLPQTTPVMRDLGNLKKMSAQSVEEKNLQLLNRW